MSKIEIFLLGMFIMFYFYLLLKNLWALYEHRKNLRREFIKKLYKKDLDLYESFLDYEDKLKEHNWKI